MHKSEDHLPGTPWDKNLILTYFYKSPYLSIAVTGIILSAPLTYAYSASFVSWLYMGLVSLLKSRYLSHLTCVVVDRNDARHSNWFLFSLRSLERRYWWVLSESMNISGVENRSSVCCDVDRNKNWKKYPSPSRRQALHKKSVGGWRFSMELRQFCT